MARTVRGPSAAAWDVTDDTHTMTPPVHHAEQRRSRSAAVVDAWDLIVAASTSAEEAAGAREGRYAIDERGQVQPSLEGPLEPILEWQSDQGWHSLLPSDDPRHDLLELYLPICSALRAKPVTVGHLGQSLDGFIATHMGESQWVTGQENVLHLHRLRALCDAVVVGAGTVAADDPRLTTRRVSGSNPLRVVFDPTRRLDARYAIFTDETAPTLYVCAKELLRAGETHLANAPMLGLDGVDLHAQLRTLVQYLHARDCARILVEGGGVTVSGFLEANLLDRLHLAIAPLLIGNGRPAVRLTPSAVLRDCRRPQYRVFRMGGDVLFDCELSPSADNDERHPDLPPVARVI